LSHTIKRGKIIHKKIIADCQLSIADNDRAISSEITIAAYNHLRLLCIKSYYRVAANPKALLF